MSSSKRRNLLEAALNPKDNLNSTEQEKKNHSELIADSILHQQQPYNENDLPSVNEFVDLESI